MYPQHIGSFLAIRVAISAYLVGAGKLFQIVKEKYVLTLTAVSCMFASLALTLMCFISGEGFASPYFASHFIVMIVLTGHFELKPLHYASIVCLIVIQYFAWQLFIPWEFKYLMLNLFLFGMFFVAGYLMHVLVYKLITEVRILSDFLPICANCKKIRDDNGYWEQVETYFRDRSEIQFSHSICPGCAKKLYPEYTLKNENMVSL